MEELINKIGNVTELVFNEYGKICRGEKTFDVSTYTILLLETSVYTEVAKLFDVDEIDEIMDAMDVTVELNDELNMSLLNYDKKDLMKKRISKKLEVLLQIDNMMSGAIYINDLADGDDKDMIEEGRIFFDGYLDLLAIGLRYMDVAYQLYHDGFREQAYRLAFMNPFVEESLKANKGVFEKYNESDQTLLDELFAIREIASKHADAEIEMAAQTFIDLAFKKNNKDKNIYRDYAMTLLVSMPVEDQFEILAEYNGYYKDGKITKKQYHRYRSLVLEADDKRIKQNI